MYYNAPIYTNNESFNDKIARLTRTAENLHEPRRFCSDADLNSLYNNIALAILFIIICIILILLLLGILKGILGLYCCPPIGMCGLGALIDLPRPLSNYQEAYLHEYPVRYDMVGWPVHPQTGKRTVRALSLRTEFCLNVIFFLTYPLVMLIFLCTLCCCTKVYDTEDSEPGYKQTKTILLSEYPSFQRKKKKTQIYRENDSTEETDTKYVLEQMQKSEASLKMKQ